jgi:hypothetical protein
MLALAWLARSIRPAAQPAGEPTGSHEVRAPWREPSPVALLEPEPAEGRTEVSPDRSAPPAAAPSPPPPEPLEAKYGELDPDGLRAAIERTRGLELRARIVAATREAQAGEPWPPETGDRGPQFRMTGLGETFSVRRAGGQFWEDATWIVERDPEVRMLHAEALWLQARIARLEASAPAAR